GVLPITASTMATNAEPAEYSAWLKDMFLPPEILDWPLNVAVVRSGGKTILIDSGLGTEFPDFPRAGQLAMRLVAAGVEPSSVTDVVLTHLHMDHIGGLLVDGLRNKLRPDLRVHVTSAEAEFWEAPDFTRTVMPAPIPDVLRRTAAQFLDVYRGQLRTFETEYEVAPGVLLRRTGGHTPGHSIVRIESGGEALTFAGDAVFQPGFDNPEWQNGFEHDPEESARVRVRLLKELAASGEQLVATHLSFPSVCHVAVAGNAFRFVPAVWDY
ncbi:MAG: MBL fold metallo-hydrolase, partial [Mycobacterium sp.]